MRDQEEDFANLLSRYLARMGFTQQELANKIGMHRNTIVKWMNRTSWPASRGQVLRLADELSLLKEEREVLVQAAGFSLERWPTEIWTVPQRRNDFFTGRETMFQALRELLVPGSTTASTQAISGLGGIGKTHTAAEYAYRFHQDYEAVLWLQADSWEVLVSACIKLADVLELPEQKEPDQIIGEMQRWLRKHRHWLLILDNIENPQEILPKFVPTDHQGCVLVTTRVHSVEPLAQTQILSTMSEQEGILFLLRRTRRIAPQAGLEKAGPEQYNEAKQIWEFMDGLPLALDQAGAYILETGCSLSDYREQYARRRAELLDRRGKRFIGHETSVVITFSLAFERVEAISPTAADILQACSLLYNEAIPEEIFRRGADLLELPLVKNESLDEALGVLQDYSLVLRSREGKLLSIHRLVQDVLRHSMTKQVCRLWVEQTVHAVDVAMKNTETGPSSRPTTLREWSRYRERYLPHLQVCAKWINDLPIVSRDAAELLDRFAHDLSSSLESYNINGIIDALHKAIRMWEKVEGPDDLHIVDCLRALYPHYRWLGKQKEAAELLRQASAIEQHTDPEVLNAFPFRVTIIIALNPPDQFTS